MKPVSLLQLHWGWSGGRRFQLSLTLVSRQSLHVWIFCVCFCLGWMALLHGRVLERLE